LCENTVIQTRRDVRRLTAAVIPEVLYAFFPEVGILITLKQERLHPF